MTKANKAKNESHYLVKDFIVILLLKFEHRRHIAFRLYGIDVLLARPLFRMEDSINHKKIGEIFYEFQDAMMIIPSECMYLYKECTTGKI